MSAGLDHATGDHVVLMHADLQDPPELIPEMLETARAGADVVYARRIGRDESWLKRSLATAFYSLMERLARTPYQGQAGDFRMMSRRVVDTLRGMPERRRFLRGMVAWVGYEQVPIEYRRAGRAAGRGASYHQLLRLAVEALASFSDVPLALAAYFGIVTAVLSSLAAAVILVCTDVRLGDREPRRLDPRLDPVPRRRAADQRRHPRALRGADARADAAAAAVPRLTRGSGRAGPARGAAERRGAPPRPGRCGRAAATPRRSPARDAIAPRASSAAPASSPAFCAPGRAAARAAPPACRAPPSPRAAPPARPSGLPKPSRNSASSARAPLSPAPRNTIAATATTSDRGALDHRTVTRTVRETPSTNGKRAWRRIRSRTG